MGAALTFALVVPAVVALGPPTVASPSLAAPPAGRPQPLPGRVAAAAPVAPLSVPAYATAAGIYARVRPGNGSPETVLAIPRPGGQAPVWGDWWGTGAVTPAFFAAGLWTFYDRVVGEATVVARVRYGARGDRPVVGDWDGDGRTDLGVVRGDRWYLTSEPGLDRARERHATVRPTSTLRFHFGTRRGQPVAGDWDGDGRDGIASYAGGTWTFRQRPVAAPAGTFFFRAASSGSARPGDRAVAGDWDGRGRDSVGLVRGTTWRLRAQVRTGRATVTTRVVRRARRGVPTPWPTTAGPRGASCPTARATYVAPDPVVTPALHLGAELDLDADDPAASVRGSLEQAERFLLGAQYDRRWSSFRYPPYLDALARDERQEVAIRRPAMAAIAVAVGLSTDAYDAATTGRTRDEALRYVDWFVRSLACQHASVTPEGWGWGWQTAHWANLVAEAAWLVWDDLAPQTRGYVTSMLLSEADYQLTRDVEYWKDASGRVLPGREGNSAAEEVAWNSALLDLAATMAPGAPRAADYRAKAVELQVAAYAVPADLTSTEVRNGVALRDRLSGTNALPDGTVINHRRVHPDYMGNVQHLWWALDFAALAGTAAPASALSNGALVYGAFSDVDFVAGQPSVSGSGAYRAPGGTIYRVGDADDSALYYPEDSDYGTSRWTPYLSLDAHAAAYGIAPAARWPASAALASHAAAQARLVADSGIDDGRTFSIDPDLALVEDRYVSREEYAAQQLATAWLPLYLASRTTVPIDTSTYPVPGEVDLDRRAFATTPSPKRPTRSP